MNVPAIDPDWIAAFRSKAYDERIPISGMLELTSRCNLRCQHCYIGSQEEQHQKRDQEMSTEQVLSVIDEIVAAGCLYFTITGGDPMMRKDFPEIYRHARSRGLLVTVFCDAILVNDRILALFDEYPPHRIEISIYGATAETYEKVTRVNGSYALAMRGIHRLLEHDYNVTLKTVLMTLNQHELEDMQALAASLDCSFRFDGAIFPCLHTEDDAPVDLRVPAETVIRHEMSTPEKQKTWIEYYDRLQAMPETDKLYTCAAGQTAFYIDPQSNASPCIMTTQDRFKMTDRSFNDVWNNEVAGIRQRTTDAPSMGELRGACNTCAAFNQVETGSEQIASGYGEELTRHRYQAIMDAKEKAATET